MHPIQQNQQIALVDRLLQACGGAYSPETRRKYYISGPQWAGAYEGQAIFHAPTQSPVGFEEIIRHYGEIGIPCWATHDTDVIPTSALFKDQQWEIVGRIKKALADNGLKCSMVTTETFYHAVWAASPAAEAPEVRSYAAERLRNTVHIGHELGACDQVVSLHHLLATHRLSAGDVVLMVGGTQGYNAASAVLTGLRPSRPW